MSREIAINFSVNATELDKLNQIAAALDKINKQATRAIGDMSRALGLQDQQAKKASSQVNNLNATMHKLEQQLQGQIPTLNSYGKAQQALTDKLAKYGRNAKVMIDTNGKVKASFTDMNGNVVKMTGSYDQATNSFGKFKTELTTTNNVVDDMNKKFAQAQKEQNALASEIAKGRQQLENKTRAVNAATKEYEKYSTKGKDISNYLRTTNGLFDANTNVLMKNAKIVGSSTKANGEFTQKLVDQQGRLHTITGYYDQNNQLLRRYSQTIGQATNQQRQMVGAMDSQIQRTGLVADSMKGLNKHHMDFSEAMGISMLRMVQWGIAATALYGTLNQFRNIADVIIQLNDQVTTMNRLIKDVNIDQMLANSTEMAKEFGIAITDVNDMMISFSRQGFKGDELDFVTNSALMATKVAFLEVEQATNILTSAMINYGIEAQNSMQIVDKLNEIDKNYATTSADVAIALQKSAGSASTFGISLDKLVGMATATSAATRETGSVIGNFLKTLGARITTMPQAANALADLNIQMKDHNNEAKSAEQLLDELGGKWDNLTAEEQRNTAVKIAGMFQVNRFTAMMANYQMVLDATTTSANSYGSAQAEMEILMSSISSKLGVLKASFQELSYSIGEAGAVSAMKTLIEATTMFVNGTNGIVTTLGKSTGAFVALGLALGTLSIAYTGASTGMMNMATTGLAADLRVKSLMTSMGASTVVANNMSVAVGRLSVAMRTLAAVTISNPFFWVGAALVGIPMLIGHIQQSKKAQDDFNNSLIESQNYYKELENKIGLGTIVETDLERAKYALKMYEEQKKQLEQREDEFAKMREKHSDDTQYQIQETLTWTKKLTDEEKELASQYGINIDQVRNYTDFLDRLKLKVGENNSVIKQAEEAMKKQNDVIGIQTSLYSDLKGEMEEVATLMELITGIDNKAVKQLEEDYVVYQGYMKALGQGAELSIAHMADMEDRQGRLAGSIGVTTDELDKNLGSIRDYIELKGTSIEAVEESIEKWNEENSAIVIGDMVYKNSKEEREKLLKQQVVLEKEMQKAIELKLQQQQDSVQQIKTLNSDEIASGKDLALMYEGTGNIIFKQQADLKKAIKDKTDGIVDNHSDEQESLLNTQTVWDNFKWWVIGAESQRHTLLDEYKDKNNKSRDEEKSSLDGLKGSYEDAKNKISQSTSQAASSVQSSSSTVISSVEAQKSAFERLLSTIETLRLMAQNPIKFVIQRSVSTFSDFINSRSPKTQNHQGGIAGNGQSILPKYHTGGIVDGPKSNEVDVRLLKNEMVLTQRQQANLFRMLNSSGAGVNPTEKRHSGGVVGNNVGNRWNFGEKNTEYYGNNSSEIGYLKSVGLFDQDVASLELMIKRLRSVAIEYNNMLDYNKQLFDVLKEYSDLDVFEKDFTKAGFFGSAKHVNDIKEALIDLVKENTLTKIVEDVDNMIQAFDEGLESIPEKVKGYIDFVDELRNATVRANSELSRLDYIDSKMIEFGFESPLEGLELYEQEAKKSYDEGKRLIEQNQEIMMNLQNLDVTDVAKQIEKLLVTYKEANDELYKLNTTAKKNDMWEETREEAQRLQELKDKVAGKVEDLATAEKTLNDQLKKNESLINENANSYKKYSNLIKVTKEEQERLNEATKNYTSNSGAAQKQQESLSDATNELSYEIKHWIDEFVNGARVINNTKVKMPTVERATVEVPKSYAKGTNGHPGGPAIISELGRELVILPNGRKFISNNNGAELVDLPKGTHVIPNDRTEEFLKALSLPQYSNGTLTEKQQARWDSANESQRERLSNTSGSAFYGMNDSKASSSSDSSQSSSSNSSDNSASNSNNSGSSSYTGSTNTTGSFGVYYDYDSNGVLYNKDTGKKVYDPNEAQRITEKWSGYQFGYDSNGNFIYTGQRSEYGEQQYKEQQDAIEQQKREEKQSVSAGNNSYSSISSSSRFGLSGGLNDLISQIEETLSIIDKVASGTKEVENEVKKALIDQLKSTTGIFKDEKTELEKLEEESNNLFGSIEDKIENVADLKIAMDTLPGQIKDLEDKRQEAFDKISELIDSDASQSDIMTVADLIHDIDVQLSDAGKKSLNLKDLISSETDELIKMLDTYGEIDNSISEIVNEQQRMSDLTEKTKQSQSDWLNDFNEGLGGISDKLNELDSLFKNVFDKRKNAFKEMFVSTYEEKKFEDYGVDENLTELQRLEKEVAKTKESIQSNIKESAQIEYQLNFEIPQMKKDLKEEISEINKQKQSLIDLIESEGLDETEFEDSFSNLTQAKGDLTKELSDLIYKEDELNRVLINNGHLVDELSGSYGGLIAELEEVRRKTEMLEEIKEKVNAIFEWDARSLYQDKTDEFGNVVRDVEGNIRRVLDVQKAIAEITDDIYSNIGNTVNDLITEIIGSQLPSVSDLFNQEGSYDGIQSGLDRAVNSIRPTWDDTLGYMSDGIVDMFSSQNWNRVIGDWTYNMAQSMDNMKPLFEELLVKFPENIGKLMESLPDLILASMQNIVTGTFNTIIEMMNRMSAIVNRLAPSDMKIPQMDYMNYASPTYTQTNESETTNENRTYEANTNVQRNVTYIVNAGVALASESELKEFAMIMKQMIDDEEGRGR